MTQSPIEKAKEAVYEIKTLAGLMMTGKASYLQRIIACANNAREALKALEGE